MFTIAVTLAPLSRDWRSNHHTNVRSLSEPTKKLVSFRRVRDIGKFPWKLARLARLLVALCLLNLPPHAFLEAIFRRPRLEHSCGRPLTR